MTDKILDAVKVGRCCIALGRDQHSFISFVNFGTFFWDTLGACSMSVTVTAQVELISGRV